jgi:hypothetical protein
MTAGQNLMFAKTFTQIFPSCEQSHKLFYNLLTNNNNNNNNNNLQNRSNSRHPPFSVQFLSYEAFHPFASYGRNLSRFKLLCCIAHNESHKTRQQAPYSTEDKTRLAVSAGSKRVKNVVYKQGNSSWD